MRLAIEASCGAFEIWPVCRGALLTWFDETDTKKGFEEALGGGMNSLAKPHAFVTDEFARLDCVQCIHSNINAAPKLIIKNVLG